MKSVFSLTALLAWLAIVSGRLTVTNNLESYTFEQFVQDHNLHYDEKEIPMRKTLFQNEVQRVQQHNSKNLKWKEGINKFSAMTKEEKKSSFGRLKVDKKKYLQNLKSQKELPPDFVVRPVSELPASVDWREKGVVSTVKDQGHCGSCWAFASTAVLESHVALSTGLLFELSVQQIAMCAPNPDQCGGVGGCGGSTAELAFDYVSKSHGLFQEYQYGYASYDGNNRACGPQGATLPVATVGGYVKLPDNNYTTLMNAIATVGPIAINVDASTWHAYSSGIFEGCNAVNPDVNHVVTLVGYGEENGQKYWLVRNSWSPAYGEKGYIRLARYDDDEQRCGSDVTPQDGVECLGSDDPVKVCGTCGAIYDSSYPINAKLVGF